MRAIEVTEELMNFTSRQAATVTRYATMELRDATPKKTGFAASNWIPSLGGFGSVAPVGSKLAVSYGSQNAGMRNVLSYRITKTPPPVIINQVAYIEILNAGSSDQAGINFIEDAVAAAIRRTANAKAS
jgi:hypothetical protein